MEDIIHRHYRDWYYRNALNAFADTLANLRSSKTKDRFVYAECLVKACLQNPELAAEYVEQNSDRIRFINHRTDKKGKLVGMDVVLSTDPRWKECRERNKA